jgi:hypothetical protein
MNPQATLASACFAQTYAEARSKFLDAVQATGLAVVSHAHPLPGHDGEPLALDVVRDGPADAAALLIISSACHGVEGFCGSGVQVALLRSEAWRAQVRASGVAVLYLHGLNPHGFSWWRRTTHENVDLNRNFVDFSQPLPATPADDELARAIVPDEWPAPEEAQQELAAYAAQHGERGLRGASATASTATPTACSSPERPPPGATCARARCCARTAKAASGWAGSICTRAWARAATASPSSAGSRPSRC